MRTRRHQQQLEECTHPTTTATAWGLPSLGLANKPRSKTNGASSTYFRRPRRRLLFHRHLPYVLLNMRMVAASRSELPHSSSWHESGCHCFHCLPGQFFQFFWARQVVRKWLNIKPSGDEFNADVLEDEDASDRDDQEDAYFKPSHVAEATNDFILLEGTSPDMPEPLPTGLLRWESELVPLTSGMLKSQEYRISVGTWNVAGRSPPDQFDLEEWLDTSEPADIYVLGFQEVVPLNAGNVLGAEDDEPAAKWDNLIRRTLNRRSGQNNGSSHSPPSSPNRRDAPDVGTRLDSIAEGAVHRDESSALLRVPDVDSRTQDESKFLSQKEEFQSRRKTRETHRSWSSFKSACEPVEEFVGSKSARRASSFKDDSVFTTEETEVSPGSSPLHSRSSSVNKSGYNTRQGYVRVASKQMVGIFISVWVRTSLRRYVHNIKVSSVGLGLMGYLGNKGSVSVSMSLHQTSFCFVCAHLTSGSKEGDELKRNSDVSEILKKTHFSRTMKCVDLPETILAHDRIIWLGDLNYRLISSDNETRRLVAREDWEALLAKDQLKLEQRAGRVFDGWHEGLLNFAPTYKYIIDSHQYYGLVQKPGDKQRAPAWCDRILWYGKGLRAISYVRSESQLSDHRPVNGVFLAEVEIDTRKLK